MMRRMRRRRRLGANRANRLARDLGEEIRRARIGLAMSQRDLARHAGVATSTIARIEAGDPGIQLDTTVAVGTAAGVDVVLRAYPGPTPKLRDSGQLAVAQQLVAMAHPRLRPQLEVPAGEFGRSADLLFLGTDEILHIEIERVAVDYQAQYRSAVAKRDHLASIHARPVRLILVIEDTPRNRTAVRPHLDVIQRQLPAGSRQILASLRSGRPLGTDGLLWIRRKPPSS
jgi:transcriptional regulator with XRE-family HTH domain